MKVAERIVLVFLLLTLIAGGFWIYFAVQKQHQDTLDAVARGEFEIRDEETEFTIENWREVYPTTVPVTIGGVQVEASVADSLSERIKGLSGTPFLPENVVKLFAFGTPGTHSIWMKDMNYAIDILWVAEDGTIVHIEENIAPETYPDSFASPVPAWYVVEAVAGFVATNTIAIGDKVVITSR